MAYDSGQWMARSTSLTVKIPAGIDNGDTVRLVGQGNQGSHGAGNGNLYIHVNVRVGMTA